MVDFRLVNLDRNREEDNLPVDKFGSQDFRFLDKADQQLG